MKVMEISPEFGLENLRMAERAEPVPGPGQVRIRMRAAAINFRDLMMVDGRYNPRQPLPLIPCSDGVGVVEELGEGVTRFKVGDRILPIFAQQWYGGEPTQDRIRSTVGGPIDGTLAEAMVLPAESAVLAPPSLSDVEAATLGCAGLTAWSALTLHGEITAGDTVVLLGTGGVSIFALQFAVALGARVIVTSSSDEKLARAKKLGAAECINYRKTPRWSEEVMERTDRRGADLVVEIGGAGTLTESIAATCLGGRIALIGVLSGAESPINIIPVFMKQQRIQGVLVGHRDGFEAMNRALESTGIRPVIDHVLPWTEAAAALGEMSEAKHFGKIALRFES